MSLNTPINIFSITIKKPSYQMLYYRPVRSTFESFDFPIDRYILPSLLSQLAKKGEWKSDSAINRFFCIGFLTFAYMLIIGISITV